MAATPVGAEERVVVDGAGRHVGVPAHITRVFAAGSPAAITLVTLAPDDLLGWTEPIRDEGKSFLPARYANLPILGRLTGRASTANAETVLSAKPDIILDLGEVDPSHVSLADRIQQQIGVPYLIFDGKFDRTPELYAALGDLLGAKDKAAELAAYARKTLAELRDGMTRVPADRRPRVYYARGIDGLETALAGSINTEMLSYVGAVNVASAPDRHSTATVSPEQVLAWNPDVIITQDDRFYHAVWTSPLWEGVSAVQKKRVYHVPNRPFGWFDSPPAVNRLIGVRWLASVLYPDVFGNDLRGLTGDFYRRFYHIDLTSSQLDELLLPPL
ncbi:MAG TPA: iron ABC transporter substrate-binding protein [Stellaceae bacterium]|nr:iron ABC transporter substrate-binding protein [Stellaceae bacterium]